jgi:acetate kinase
VDVAARDAVSPPRGDILVVNAGSTSLKLRLVGPDDGAREIAALADVDAATVRAVAHRVVHGGPDFTAPVVIDAAVRERIQALTPLAPLHNAPALRGIESALAALPELPQIAVFDTAFHASMPAAATTYAVPEAWREAWGVRRYGFHGLSVAWSAERAPELLGRPADGLRLVVCHLGGGNSVTAVRDGRSVDTSMGFTPMEGVPMATRSGSLDPGVILYVAREHGLDAAQLDRALNLESGVAALAGRPGGVHAAAEAAAAGDPRAALAMDVLGLRIAGVVAAMAVAAGGLDALVFTAGDGERSPALRAAVCDRLTPLGVRIDPARNAAAIPDTDIAADGAAARVLVIHAREEVITARAARALLDGGR